MFGFGGAIFMTMIFWDRFNSNPIRITIQPVNKQTSAIPFPGITICTGIRYLPKKIDKLVSTLNLPDDISTDDLRNAFRSLIGYNYPVHVNSKDINLLINVFNFNNHINYSIHKIFSEIEPKCEDILIKCRWEQRILPCKNLFQTAETLDGHCCSFNRDVGQKDFKKLHTLFYGPQMGLSIIVDPKTSEIEDAYSVISSTGIKILVHNPVDYPDVSSIEKSLGNGTESYIRILSTRLTSSESVRSLTPEQRHCLFEDERQLDYFSVYKDTNCATECKMKENYNYCECIPYTYPTNNRRVCGLSDIICLANNYNNIYRQGVLNNSKSAEPSCVCPAQCNDIFYSVQTTSIPMSYDVPTLTTFYDVAEKYKHVQDRMVIHMYFGSFHQTGMLRDSITSTYYLLSSFGGVFSLFLGCSFLSILEILYFFCYRMFTKYND